MLSCDLDIKHLVNNVSNTPSQLLLNTEHVLHDQTADVVSTRWFRKKQQTRIHLLFSNSVRSVSQLLSTIVPGLSNEEQYGEEMLQIGLP